MKNKNQFFAPFILVTSLFFFWGFIHNLDPILIPHLRKSLSLNYIESSLVDSSVFIAYFVMALPAGFVMKKYGYKTGIIIGLLLFAIGLFLFLPAADTRKYLFFLSALFIIASGLAFLETAANPYMTLLGDPATATQRLNFAQSFNGLAVTLAPVIGGYLILSSQTYNDAELSTMTATVRDTYLANEAASVKSPYLALAVIISIVAFLFWLIKLPDFKAAHQKQKGNLSTVLRNKSLLWGVVTQFFYVGAQVCVQSFFILIATKAAGIGDLEASKYLGYGYGIAFMGGRFFGTYVMRFIKPPVLLLIYSIINIVLTGIVIRSSGMITVYALVAIAFFMSIMFPTIFSLGIHNLGVDAELGSSLIIMSIVGGALLPPVLGLIADKTHNIQLGYSVPLICFVVVALFANYNRKNEIVLTNKH